MGEYTKNRWPRHTLLVSSYDVPWLTRIVWNQIPGALQKSQNVENIVD